MDQTYTDVNDIFYNSELTPSFMTGSEVIREAIKRASVGTSVAYPITPQSEAAALIGEIYAEGYLDEYFRGESEFAVMGQCAGAAFGGHRVFTPKIFTQITFCINLTDQSCRFTLGSNGVGHGSSNTSSFDGLTNDFTTGHETGR
jgi:hypothetical protein